MLAPTKNRFSAFRRYNWYYETVPQKYMNNRVMYCPRGRVLGGSSALNAMVYVRGHPFDYDRWAKEGATGKPKQSSKRPKSIEL